MSCSPAWYMSPAGSRACGFWRNMSSRAAQPPRITARATAQGTAARRSGAKVRVKGEFCAKRFSPIGAQFYGQSPPKSRTLTGPGGLSIMPAMPLPTMYRVRQSFPRERLADIPAGVRAAMDKAALPVKRGDTVAVGAGSRGIANIAVIVRAVVDHLKDLGAKPFVFPAMGSHGGATAEGQLEILAHYGITEGAMGCPLRASMDVVEDGYDETAVVEAFNAENLEAGERRLLKDAREWMARLPFSPIDVLVVEEVGKNISGAGMDTNVIGRPSNPHEPFPSDPKILWIVALDLTEDSGGNATGIGNADFTTRRLAEKIDWKKTAINSLTACAPNGAKLPLSFDSDREAVESALNCIGLTKPEQARVIRIKNTLMIGEIECSEAYLPEITKRADLEIVGEARPLGFDAAGQVVPLSH